MIVSKLGNNTLCSCVALSQLVEHADPLLDALQVPGDAPQVQGRQTRAKKSQGQVYLEPLRIRIVKLLTRDLGIAIEDEEGDVESIDSREEDDDDWLAGEDEFDLITGVGENGNGLYLVHYLRLSILTNCCVFRQVANAVGSAEQG